jgi:hypothetical protein
MAQIKSALSSSAAPRRAAPVVDAAKAEAERNSLSAFIAALVAAIAAVFRFVFGGTWGDLKRDVGGIRKAAGLARTAGGHALVGVGKGLELPLRAADATASAVGATLGAMILRAPVGPRQVADTAVAQDDARQTVQSAPRRYADVSAERYGRTERDAAEVQLWARAMRKSDRSLVKTSAGIDPAVFSWLTTCTSEQLLRLEQLPPSRVLAHLLPTRDSDRSMLLPPAVGIERLDAGPDANEILHKLGLSDEERRTYLPAGEYKPSRRPSAAVEQDNEEAYTGPVPVFGR